MPEYLEPVVTKLLGDLSDLAKTLAEAEALMKGYQDRTEKTSEESGKRTGKKTGESILAELKKALQSGSLADLNLGDTGKRITGEFEKAGKDGAAGLYREFAKALGPGGLDTAVGRQVIDSFAQVGQKGGMQAGELFKGGFLSALGDMAAAASPVLAPVAAVLVAEVFADVGGAVEGGLGLGGLITGAIVQIKTNPQVQAAAKDFGSWLGAQLKDDTASFAQPLEDAFAILKTGLGDPMGDLKKDFAYLAPYVREFAMYLGSAAEKFMPGFNRAVQSSGPVIEEFGHGLLYVADGLNIMFDEISKGGKGEVEALDILFRVLGGTLAGLGFLIRVAANGFDAYVQVSDKAIHATTAFYGAIYGWIPGANSLFGKMRDYVDGVAHSFDNGGPALQRMIEPMNSLTAEVQRQKDEMDALTGAWDKWFGVSMHVDEATLRLHEDVTALSDSLQQNGRHWDLNTKAGQANYGALLQAIQGAHDLRQAQIDSGHGTDEANKAYQATVDRLLDMAGKANLSASQIAYLRAQVGDLTGALNSLNGKVVHYSVIGSGGNPGSFPQGLAEGGVVGEYGGLLRAAQGMVASGILPARSPGTLVLAGEPGTGGEVLAPLRGISKQRAMGLAGVIGDAYGFDVGGGGGGGGSPAPIVVQLVVDGQVFYEKVVVPQARRQRLVYGSNGL